MYARRAIALALALVVALATSRARAWQEVHQTGDDARVIVDAHGVASVLQELHWHVVRGPLRSIDLNDFDPSAVVEPAVAVAADDGRTLSAHAARRDERTVRITIDDPSALARGNFTFDVHWRVDLVAARAISRDGATWRLAWSTPASAEGFDNARTTIDLAAAPGEPCPIVADTGAIDDGAVATLRRGPERDVLELVRLHVARGESVTWTVRVDPRALPLVVDPRVRPTPQAFLAAEPDRVGEATFGALLAMLALGFGWLVRHKARAVAVACEVAGVRGRGLLPLPHRARAMLAGVALAAAVGLEVAGETIPGALCTAIATLAAAFRAPSASLAVRGPGRWQALSPDQAFKRAPVRGHWLDIGSGAGRQTALGAALLVVLVALVTRQFDAEGPWFAALDAAALVPLFVTGRAIQLPPHGVRSAVPWLSEAFQHLLAVAEVQVTPWARVAPDGIAADELRLLVLPRMAMPGLVGLEVGLAWSSTPVGWAATPEVLARVLEGSAAAAKLRCDLPDARAVPGRRSDERVVRLIPCAPTRASAVALALALAAALTDRRISLSADSSRYPRRGTVRAIERRAGSGGEHGAATAGAPIGSRLTDGGIASSPSATM